MTHLAILSFALLTQLPAPDALQGLARVEGYLGVVLAQQELDVAAQIAGTLAGVDVRVGDHVRSGQVLFRLDDELLRHEVEMARAMFQSAGADLDRSRVALEQAGRQYRRKREAAAVLSTEEVEKARATAEMARADSASSAARLAQERARLALLEANFRQTRGTAPFAGIVAGRYAELGASVRPTTPVVRLIADTPPYIRFAVPPAEVGHFAPGTEVDVVLPGVARPVPARVRSVAPEVDAAIDMILVEADLAGDADGPASGVRVGMIGKVNYRRPAEAAPPARAASDR